MITPNLYLGLAFHAIGAVFAAVCYTPQKRVRGWSWQSYWLTQAAFCWLILPIVVAWITTPNIGAVLSEADKGTLIFIFFLGAAYGIGGTTFGISIRYIGYSLTYAIAIGLSTVLGTLLPPFLQGTLGEKLSFDKPGTPWVIAGMTAGLLGIALTGLAGRMKERDLSAQASLEGFSLIKGLLLSLTAGTMAAVYSFALAVGEPVAEIAARHGAGVYNGLVVYIFTNTGAFLSASIYCFWLHFRHKTLGEIVELPAGAEKASLPVNWAMALLTGCLWYGQFFFYNLGHVRLGDYKFLSWGMHMIMLILFSVVVGLVLREWRQARLVTRIAVGIAVVVLVSAVVFLGYGNKLSEGMAGH